MQDQDKPGGWEHAQQLPAAAISRAVNAVQDMVAEFCSRTVQRVRSQALIWPGVNGVDPEPIACLEAARELERAAHDMQHGYILRARQAGRSWYEIGEALDLDSAASADREPLAVEAYDYALRFDPRPSSQVFTFTWPCPACEQAITDHGPYVDLARREEGHGPACPRWAAAQAAWEELRSQGPAIQ